jgi:hypothetical protein
MAVAHGSFVLAKQKGKRRWIVGAIVGKGMPSHLSPRTFSAGSAT